MKPKDLKDLRPLRKSLVDPSGWQKRYIPGFISRSKSRLSHAVRIPGEFPWAGGTLENLTITGSSIGLTTPGTGIFTSQALIQTDLSADLKKDIDYIKITCDHVLNGGTVKYFISNDGVSFPIEVLTQDALYKLPKADDDFNNFQNKFNDLRIRIVITENAVVNSVLLKYSLIN